MKVFLLCIIENILNIVRKSCSPEGNLFDRKMLNFYQHKNKYVQCKLLIGLCTYPNVHFDFRNIFRIYYCHSYLKRIHETNQMTLSNKTDEFLFQKCIFNTKCWLSFLTIVFKMSTHV